MSVHRYWRLFLVEPDTGAGAFAGSHMELKAAGTNYATNTASIAASNTFGGFDVRGLINGSFGQWATLGTYGEWISYDLGSGNEQDIDEVIWESRTDNSASQAPKAFILQWSDDNATWTNKFYGFHTGWTLSDSQDFAWSALDPNASHEWWGLGVIAPAVGSSAFSIAELQHRATVGGSSLNSGGTPGGTSPFGVDTPSLAFDSNTGTIWASPNQEPGWMIWYQFASAVAVAQVSVHSRTDSFFAQTPTTWDNIVSDDGKVWDIAWKSTVSTWSADEEQTDDNPHTASDGTGEGAIGTATTSAPGGLGGVFTFGEGPIGTATTSAPTGGAFTDTGGIVTEVDVAALLAPVTDAKRAELDIAVPLKPVTIGKVAEVDVAVLAVPTTSTTGGISEVDVSVLTYIGPCATSRCQVWRIIRRDGAVKAFTSLDRDITWQGTEFKACKSLSAGASSSSAELGQSGDQELKGILDDASISEGDLYAGLYDDAFVEAWLIPYDGQPDDQAPRRLISGFTGKVTRLQNSFVAEVLGQGARLKQAALVDVYTPGCKHAFGVLNDQGIGCPVDADGLSIAGAVVTTQQLRQIVRFSGASDPGGSTIWNQGKVIWTSGRNAGVECQIDTMDWGAHAVSLWDLAPYPPEAGDTFTIRPGCPKTKPACQTYGVYVSFGGFDDVPGPDALQSNADSLFTG